MNLIANNLMCTGKPKPNHWEMDGRKGTTYKVELSDGTGNVALQCIDEDIYNKFEPFQIYDCNFELVATNYEGRAGVKCRVVFAEAHS